MNPDTRYICSSESCGRVVDLSVEDLSAKEPLRCDCGAILKKPYRTPHLRRLTEDEFRPCLDRLLSITGSRRRGAD